jgi:hypothetical protein
MDPYLEQSAFWSSFHTRLMVAIADALDGQLFPNYYVDIESRTYLEDDGSELLVGIPDALVLAPRSEVEPLAKSSSAVACATRVESIVLPMAQDVRERYLEVREVGSGETIVVIELLSPKNKQAGLGRETYLRKRRKVLASLTHLVEIDLLRSNRPMPRDGGTTQDYHIIVSRSEYRPNADLYSFSIQDALPTIQLPLKGETESIALDLQAIFTALLNRTHYDARIDYSLPMPSPKPSPEVQAWIDERLARRG